MSEAAGYSPDAPFALPMMDEMGFWILLGAFAFFLFLESLFALRQRNHTRKNRWWNNSLVAVFGLPAARLLLLPLTVGYAYFLGTKDFGLLNWVEWPAWLEITVGMLILDYAIYIWHRLNHGIPFLWRFHQVHHIDLDMDISTGIRFHVGELLMSIPFRLVIITFSGVSPLILLLYEVIFEAATLFHHSNIRLPLWFERILVKFIVTPRSHGIHHSLVKSETDSNYSTVLNWWDRLHRTAVFNVPQRWVHIGVPAFREGKRKFVWVSDVAAFPEVAGVAAAGWGGAGAGEGFEGEGVA